jgi:hypothetical protein
MKEAHQFVNVLIIPSFSFPIDNLSDFFSSAAALLIY